MFLNKLTIGWQLGIFARRTKKLNAQAKQALDEAVRAIINETTIGELKVGDLAGVRVYKYKHTRQQYLLALYYKFVGLN